jgi:hypothetical protein
MDTFQHPMPTMQDAATKAIEEALGATIGGTAAPESDTNSRASDERADGVFSELPDHTVSRPFSRSTH